MLPRELIEELVGGCGATRLHILVALADGIDSFLIILALPLEVVGQRVVERVSRTFPSSARKVLQLCQSLRLERNRVHFLKVEVRQADVNSAAALRQVAIPMVGRVLVRGDGIVWKVDSPGLARFLVGVVLQVQLRLVVSEHVDVPR